MDFNEFLPKKIIPIPVIQKEADIEKYDAIAAKLCEKRLVLEEKLRDQTITDSARDEYATDLLQLKESMRTFGVNEVDYHAYLAYKEKEGGVQMELL